MCQNIVLKGSNPASATRLEGGGKKKKENPQTTNVETIWNDLIHASNPFVLLFPCSVGEFELNAVYWVVGGGAGC